MWRFFYYASTREDVRRKVSNVRKRVIIRKAIPATSALFITISVCANANKKNLATAWISNRSGIFSNTLRTETVVAMMTTDPIHTIKGAASLRNT